MTIFPISRPALGGFIDRVEVDPAGVVRIVGWHRGDYDEAQAPAVSLDGQAIPFLQQFRFLRNDVTAAEGELFKQAGLVWEYLLPQSQIGDAAILEIDFGWEGEGKTRFEAELHFLHPHHRELLETSTVFHRAQIYGPGPPNTSIHPQILELAQQLKGPVLDFGCGRGLLVENLVALGVEAHGLELDTPTMRECLPAGRANGRITLYDGTFPTPFASGEFVSVICSEVLEHIADYEAAIREMARLARERVLFTVPDASAIPLGYRHGAVPWHLMESTHCNFFTQQSLKRALTPHFSKVEFGRVGRAQFNDTSYYVSLAALCVK